MLEDETVLARFSHQPVIQVWKTRAAAACLPAACMSVLAGYLILYTGYPADDAYIHMRIARNFVTSGMPYYNPDQAVAGSSSLFWLVTLALLFKLFGASVHVVQVLSYLFIAGALLLSVAVLLQRCKLPQAIALAFLLVALNLLDVAVGMMETPAAICFWLLALLCWRNGSWAWMGFWSATTFTVRYEFAVWLVVSWLALGGRARWRYIQGAVGPLIFFVAFQSFFFGSLIPNTVVAKSRLYGLSGTEFLSVVGMNKPLFALFAAANLLLLGYAFKEGRSRVVKAAALFPLAVFGLYLHRRALIFSWYWPIVFFPLMLSYTLALSRRQWWVLLFLWGSIADVYGVWSGELRLYREYEPALRVRQYLYVGAELRREFPNARLMTSEVGGLGWTFGGTIIDAAGIVSPETLQYHPMRVPEDRPAAIIGSIPPQAVLDLKPDLVVSMETFSHAFRRDIGNGHIKECRLLRNYPVIGAEDAAEAGISSLWGSQYIQIFRCEWP